MRHLFVLAIAGMACVSSRGARIADVPELFAPQLWQPGEEVHGGTFTADGKSFYFFKKVGAGEDFRIVVSQAEGGTWGAPKPVSFSSTTSDLYPAVSSDGRRIVFSSYRRVPGDTSRRPNAHLWIVERRGDEWGEPRPLREISSLGDYHPGVRMLPNGTLYFRVWSRTDYATYRAPLVDGSYPRRERVTAFERDSIRVWGAEPSPAEDRFFLTIAPLVRAPATFGAGDIYVARRTGGTWSPPVALSPIVNTAANEATVAVTPDGRRLLFVRDGKMYQIAIAALGLD